MQKFLEASQGRISDTLQNAVTILVIDDDSGIRLVVERLLKRAGYTVISADSGVNALKQIETGVPNLGAVLVDLSMPGMTGDLVVAKLVQRIPDVPLIMMSGYQPELIVEKFVNNEVIYFLQKPFTYETLYKVIYTAVNQHRFEPKERAVGL